MAKDLTVILQDRPGTLADLGETLGKAGVNIEGFCGIPSEGKGVIHVLVEDAAAASGALRDAGIEVRTQQDVLLLTSENRPGELGDLARKIANAGVNIDFGYLASGNRLVLGVADLAKAKAAL